MIVNEKKNKFLKAFDFAHEHIIAIIISVVLIAGIGSTIVIFRGDVKPGVAASDDKTYESVNTIYLSMNQVNSLNPLESTDKDVYYINQLIYSSLFKPGTNLNLEKDLVGSYTTDSSGGTVTVTLKDDAKFSDGSEVTGEDVKYTVNRIIDTGSKCPYYEYANKIREIRVSGSKKFTVIFEEPSDAALDNLIFPIVAAKSYSSESNHVIGSGQYKIRSYNAEKVLRLVPNEYYFGEVATNNVQLKIIPDKAMTTGFITMDAITAYVSTSKDSDADAEDKNLLHSNICSSELEYMGFNFDNKYLSNRAVRQAIAYMVDTKSIIEDNYGGMGIVSDSIYFPGFLGTKNTGDPYDADPKKAMKLLENQNIKDIDEDGILEDSHGNELKFTIIVNENNSSRVDTALTIAEALKESGINTAVKKLSWSEYKSALRNRRFDIYLGGYKFDKKYDLRELFAKSNNIGYNNGAVLNYVVKLETSLSAKKERLIFESLKKELNDDVPYYAICYKSYSFITVKHFKSEEEPTFFDFFRGISTWTWERGIAEKKSNEKTDDE